MGFVTLGGVTVGACVFVTKIVHVWPGLKGLKSHALGVLGKLLPFAAGWAYGGLAVLSVGGLVGFIADTTLWISNWLGDAALVWGVGGHSGQSAGSGHYLPLTQAGGGIVLILTAAMLAAMRKSKYGTDLKMGFVTGVCLSTSAGIAGAVAVPLAESANWLGSVIYGAL